MKVHPVVQNHVVQADARLPTRVQGSKAHRQHGWHRETSMMITVFTCSRRSLHMCWEKLARPPKTSLIHLAPVGKPKPLFR